jgi:hypothetical protein
MFLKACSNIGLPWVFVTLKYYIRRSPPADSTRVGSVTVAPLQKI